MENEKENIQGKVNYFIYYFLKIAETKEDNLKKQFINDKNNCEKIPLNKDMINFSYYFPQLNQLDINHLCNQTNNYNNIYSNYLINSNTNTKSEETIPNFTYKLENGCNNYNNINPNSHLNQLPSYSYNNSSFSDINRNYFTQNQNYYNISSFKNKEYENSILQTNNYYNLNSKVIIYYKI